MNEFADYPCEEIQAKPENAAAEPASNRGSVALVYEGKYQADFTGQKYALPGFGESHAQPSAMRTIVRRSDSDAKKFIFADGGFREKYVGRGAGRSARRTIADAGGDARNDEIRKIDAARR